jgi:serine/threonine protein kinase
MADSSSVDKLIIDRQKVLGMGNYGSVFEGIWGGIKVAVKRIVIENVARDKTTKTEREGNALNKLDHENVIKLFDVEENIDFKYFKY